MESIQVGNGKRDPGPDPFSFFTEEELKDNPYLVQACRAVKRKPGLEQDDILRKAEKLKRQAIRIEEIRKTDAEKAIAAAEADEKEAEAQAIKANKASRMVAARARAQQVDPSDKELQEALVVVQEAYFVGVIADDRKRLMDRYTGNLAGSLKVMLCAIFLPILNMLSDFIGHWPLAVCGLILAAYMLHRMRHIDADFKEAFKAIEDGKPVPDKELLDYIKKNWRRRDGQG